MWIGAVAYFDVPSYVLPTPGEILSALADSWMNPTFWYHAWFTVQGAMIGCLAGAVLAVLCAVVVSEIRVAKLAFYPLVIAIQSMPTIALAPLIIIYLGVGLASKIVTVGLLCFFPVFVNTVAGLETVDPRLVDLYRSASATRLRLFWDVKLPGALDHIMAGFQVATVLAFVGCVVSEFIASKAGLGYLIKAFANDLNVAIMFAAVITLAFLGALTGFLVTRLQRRLVFWRER